LGVSNLLRLNRPEFADRLVKSLSTRLRGIYDAALADVELWNKAAAAQLDAQVRERRRTFTKRVEAIERIQEAAGSLEERIQEMESQTLEIAQLSAQLDRLSAPLLDDEVGHDSNAGTAALLAEKRLLISD
jgi:DNA anti-recombination protein RmuC